MFELSRPDVTDQGWHTWPTEQVSQTLRRPSRSRSLLETYAAARLAGAPKDVAVIRLAPVVRHIVEGLVGNGPADELRESLVTYALSRVDWLQLAQMVIEEMAFEDPEPEGFQVFEACAS